MIWRGVQLVYDVRINSCVQGGTGNKKTAIGWAGINQKPFMREKKQSGILLSIAAG